MKVGWAKGIVEWTAGRTLYLSVPFTWLLDEARRTAKGHRGPVIAGGPAVKLMGAPWADETPPTAEPFDVLAMHNPLATFTTRGCPRRCAFCAVPKIDGPFRELDEWRPAPMVCDNNLLAASEEHFRRVLKSLEPFPEVDFNQGLDARLLSDRHLSLLADFRCGGRRVKLRFAWDSDRQASAVEAIVHAVGAAGFKDVGVYVLVGFRDSPDEALGRLETVRSWEALPFPMRYQPLDAREKNGYVAPGWTEGLLRDVCRYYSKLNWVGHIPFEKYHRSGEMPLLDGSPGPRTIRERRG